MIEDKFVYNHDFQSSVNQMIIFRESINQVREKLLTLRGHISSVEWSGGGQEEAKAYTWLIILYMNQLCGSSITPSEKMEDTLKSFMNQVEAFDSESKSGVDLNSIRSGF